MTIPTEAGISLQNHPVPFENTGFFSPLFQAYIQRDERFKGLVNHFPDSGAFQLQMEEKARNYPERMRILLQNRLRAQMGDDLSDKQKQHLDSLTDARTFSVSCGHQLNLAGGPMYVAYKIWTIIRLAADLESQYPGYRFVPIHWLATEDHDWEEVADFRYYGGKYSFQTQSKGAVGRMHSADIADQLAAIKDMPSWMVNTYRQGKTVTGATRLWLQKVFGAEGLLVIDADDAELKKELLPLAIKELQHPWIETAVKNDTQYLESLGFKSQIHAREINLFYLGTGERLRLEKKDETIRTVDGPYSWPLAGAELYFSQHPDVLSPNVAFRPLFSQILLPDVAFIGGPAEVSYWMQLRTVFAEAQVTFPLLIPRFSGLYLTQNQARKWKKLGFSPEDLFKELPSLKKEFLVPENLLPQLEAMYANLIVYAAETDITLVPTVKAELNRMQKQAEGVQKRIQKAAEQRHEQQIQQIIQLKNQLFPHGGLQERTESWLSFYHNDPDWGKKVFSRIHPLDFRFQVLIENQ